MDYRRITNIVDAEKEMQRAVEFSSEEAEHAHEYADQILCRLLYTLGHENLVKLFLKVTRWYA